MLNAIILAGTQSIKKWNDSGNKALFRINGRMMIDYVIDAVKGASDIDRVVIVGPKSELAEHFKDRVDAVIDCSGSIMENIITGAKYLGNDNHILICSSDIPLVTSEAISDFIHKANALNADLCYPIVEKSENDKKYPEIERTYVRIKEGTFTGGNIFYVNPLILDKGFTLAEKLVNNRKKPLKMAKILSFRFLVQLLLGNLTIERIEKRFSKILDIHAKAVISKYPEIGNDVDKPSDVIIATAHLSK